MIRAAVISVSLCASSLALADPIGVTAPDQATIDGLANDYALAVAGVPVRCTLSLKAKFARAGAPLRLPVSMSGSCRDRFPSLGRVSNWEPTGGGSIRLLGGTPLRELADFSPVQDGSGVYLRGGFAGDSTIYELRLPQE